jgi:tetratricopeptide (TPR) repeat protein
MNILTNNSGQPLGQAANLLRQGRNAEAAQVYEAILRTSPRQFDALHNLGLIRLQQKKFSDAADLFRRAAKVDKTSAVVRNLLAICLSETGALEEAVEHFRKAIALQPGVADTHKNLGNALFLLGRHEEAARQCQRALAIRPGDPVVHTTWGNALFALKRHEEALQQYGQVIPLLPNSPEAHRNLAVTLSELDRQQEAIVHCERAIELAPRYADAHLSLAKARAALGQTDAVIAQYEKLLALDPNHAGARRRLAQTLFLTGRAEAAMAQFDRVLAANPQDLEALILSGVVLRALGKKEAAIDAFEKAIALDSRAVASYYELAQSRRFAADDPHFAAMKRLARETGALSPESQVSLHFSLGKIHGDLGEHQQAFRHLLLGNTLKRRQIVYREDKVLGYFEAVEKVFTPAMLAERSGNGDPSRLPIFIIGMPRSGTTLVEQILASHSKVFGAGESYQMMALAEVIKGPNGSVFPEAVTNLSAGDFRGCGAHYIDAMRDLAPDAERITDKMPSNLFRVGLIHLALPNARIIHLRRDPRDVAVSCFSLLFTSGQNFSYDLAELGRYIRAYQKLMAHWRTVLPPGAMMDVDYEEIVDDLEGQSRRILDYCGLPWNDAVLSFHTTERAVTTASVTQVRQPIYDSSRGRWRHYEKELRPLLDILQAP